MQILDPRALDAAAAEPLLSAPRSTAATAAALSGGGAHSGDGHGHGSAGYKPKPVKPGDLQFLSRFRALMALLRPWPALLLSLLSVAEALVVAEVGKVAGGFYKIVLDDQPGRFAAAMVHAGALYAASAVIYAASCFVTERLSLAWRQWLTGHLHACYCGDGAAAYFLLQQPGGKPQEPQEQQQQQQQQGQHAHGNGGETGTHERAQLLPQHAPAAAPHGDCKGQQQGDGQQRGGGALDNPDQRIASDAAELCESLSVVARVAAAAPFKLLYYSWLTCGYLGWRGLGAVYAFFWVAAAVQRLAVAPVARLVFAQERREGDLRFAHLRLREYAAEVALYGAAATERAHLDATLAAALANQGRLVRWRAALAGVTRCVDYCGALLNYFCVGAAVFSGFAVGAAGGDSGALAQFVSNASFACLSLIYSFTELLDLSDQMSRLGGLTARVGQLLELLPGGLTTAGRGSSVGGALGGGGRQRDLHAVRLSMDGRELQPSRFATLVQPPRVFSCLGGGVRLEASVHRLGPDLLHEARAIFPDAPPRGQLLACITFQAAAGGASLAPDGSSASLERAAAEMDRMLDAFLRWEEAVRSFLEAHGCWCNAVDPRTGMALHGPRGGRWSEVAAAHALLGYERRDAGVCPVVLHPLHGSSAYPASLFTDAPPALLDAALAAVADSPPSPALASLRASSGSPGHAAATAAEAAGSGGSGPLLVSLQGVSVETLAGGLAVADLSVDLAPGQHLLMAGPNGCGKSTFLKALCGLHPLAAGRVQLLGGAAAERGVMFVPQRPLAAPGAALWQQLCYPGSSGGELEEQQPQQRQQRQQRPPDSELLALLQRVGLQHLLERTGGSLDAPADWGGQLSPGELQRLAVARVLHRRPALAVLDEVTSAVSAEAARQLYGQLHADGITCISIGQDCQHLRQLHPLLLRLGCGPAPGAWQLQP